MTCEIPIYRCANTLRVFYLDARTQTWRPSKKGVGFIVERWPAFCEAVLQADQLLRQVGDIR
jgi:hypothetical protein